MGQLGSGVGMEGMNFSGMMPIPQIVAGYNPKRRDISYMIMGQLERSLGVPIVVINSDGSVNHALTAEYAMNLDEGFESMKDGVFNDAEGNPYEIVKVGVDAQSIYDADPLDSSRPLQKNGMGIGRINWNKVPTEVRQVVYFAVKQTNEINPSDQSNLQWLRDNIKPTATRMTLRGLCPSANNAYNEAFRTGSLPTLRVQLSRSPRRPSTMPNRRSKTPRDLSDYGKEDMSSVEDGFRG
ncbi:MAG: hypothetical protein Q8Q23_02495 [bacterium]|nr:hypothetical protein [bacterium]